MRCCKRVLLAGAALGIFSGHAATAAEWPEKPVRIVVPYAAGGNTDLIARQTAQILAEAFGKSFIAENRLGANGVTLSQPNPEPLKPCRK